MAKTSAGIILYRPDERHRCATWREDAQIEILLVHPGGPYWANKDEHGWSIPKGEYDPTEEEGLDAAEREFQEELGSQAPNGDRLELPKLKTSSKVIQSWLVEGDFNPEDLNSNLFDLEWPPKSGRVQQFPEVDRCQWFDLVAAKTKLHKGQLPLIDLIQQALASR